ncbi:MAG: ion channel [Burkholderiaceae bacterium]
MFAQILIGSIMISISIIIMTASVSVAILCLSKTGRWIVTGPAFTRLTSALTAVTLWLLAAISLVVWVWAVLFLSLGLFDSLEPSLYFSIVALTTLGFGDIILPESWRLLSGFIAANGLVLFGLNTAFLIEAVIQLNAARKSNTPH